MKSKRVLVLSIIAFAVLGLFLWLRVLNPPSAKPLIESGKSPTSPKELHPKRAVAQSPDESDEFSKEKMSSKDTFSIPRYKIMGKHPEGWVVLGAPREGRQEVTLFFKDPDFPKASPSLYYRIFPEPMQLTGDGINAWMRKQAAAKARQRVSNGLSDYAIDGDFAQRNIGERPALTWTASYTRSGEPWGEYLTRIYTPQGTFLFLLNAPKSDLPALIPGFERIITTTIVR